MATTTDTSPEALHERMIEAIVAHSPHLPRTIEAMRTIPRHGFLRAINPDISAEDAYDPDLAVTTLTDPSNGATLSCSSVPTLVATMLDQADVQPGDNVLEIGSATGINAAYLAHLAGPDGHVTTVDIDSWVTAGTRKALDTNNFERVAVVTRDGALGFAENAPYDKIVVTVGAWDLAGAWWTQLRPGGRLVVPLRWRGQTRGLALLRDGDQMRSESVVLCGFVPMIGQDGEKTASIDPADTVNIYWDEDQPIDATALAGILDQPKTETWTDVTVVSQEPFDGIWLRLTSVEPGTCRIEATPEAVTSGLCTPGIPIRSPALIEDSSLAYFTLRLQEQAPTRRWELGAAGHGPRGERLAERLCAQIRAWGDNRSEQPSIVAYRGRPFDTSHLAHVVTKPDCQLTVTYPGRRPAPSHG
jgi:protein-L-isoaspartate(D-aspartate) O-methyltransferase